MLSPQHLRLLREARHWLRLREGCSVGQITLFGQHEGVEKLYIPLVRENVLSISPDGLFVKWTDYGLALYQETEALQQAWTETPVITLDDANKDQIVIRQGEAFRGKYFVLQILKRAKGQVCIQDNFCSHEILAWLYSVPAAIEVRVLTSKKTTDQDKTFTAIYQDYKKERPNAEVRLLDKKFHDRKLFIDGAEGFQVGESLKDIGNKGTTITRLRDIGTHIQEFESLWNAAKPL